MTTAVAASTLFGQIQQGNVNVQILGHICWTSSHNVELTQDRFAEILTSVGLPASLAKEHNWRSAFIRALRNMEEKRLIRLVEENGDRLVYQFTAEKLQETADVPFLNYVKETVVVINKAKYAENGDFAEAIVQGDPEIKKRVIEIFNVEKHKYNSADMNRYVQKIFRTRADIVTLRDQGGVYFVPATYQAVVQIVSQLAAQVPGLSFNYLPIPDVESSRRTVSEAVNDEVLASLAELDRDMKAVTDGFVQVTDVWRKTRLGRIEAVKERIKQYGEILVGAGESLQEKTRSLELRLLGPRKLNVDE